MRASFWEYVPPFDPVPIVQRMLDSIPEKYLCGLSEVVLTNAGGMNRERRRSVTNARGRKVKVATARGLYHQEWKGRPARIEIFIDNALKGWDKGIWLNIPYIRELLIGEVLFHEVGHHIHFAIRPEYREKEDVADVWKLRLRRNYEPRRFPLLRAFALLIRPFSEPWRRRVEARMLESGQVSRAEYEESVGITKASKDRVPK